MITREQVADLQPGDVVEITEVEEGNAYTHKGPLTPDGSREGGGLAFCAWWVRNMQGEPGPWIDTLTVVSRAPRPLYVNHPRTTPVYGDVVRDADDPDSTDTWRYSDDDSAPWVGFRDNEDEDDDHRDWDWFDRDELPDRLRLLVDGEEGDIVLTVQS